MPNYNGYGREKRPGNASRKKRYEGKSSDARKQRRENPVKAPYNPSARHNCINLNKPLHPTVREVYDTDRGECVYCGARHHLTMDHIVPECNGGQFTPENLVLACFNCNHDRGCRVPSPMLYGRFREG